MNKSNNQNTLNQIFGSSGGGIDQSTVDNAIKSKNPNELLKKLGPEDQRKLEEILSDKTKLEAALKTPEAQLLLKFLKGGKKG